MFKSDNPIIKLSNLTIQRDKTKILENINWEVNQGEHWVVIGGNGSGKTTLLKRMLGHEHQDSGNIKKTKGLTIGYLAQEITVGTDRSILEEVLASYPEAYELERKILFLSMRENKNCAIL